MLCPKHLSKLSHTQCAVSQASTQAVPHKVCSIPSLHPSCPTQSVLCPKHVIKLSSTVQWGRRPDLDVRRAQPDERHSGHHAARQHQGEDENVEQQADTAPDLHLELRGILKIPLRQSEDVKGPERLGASHPNNTVWQQNSCSWSTEHVKPETWKYLSKLKQKNQAGNCAAT